MMNADLHLNQMTTEARNPETMALDMMTSLEIITVMNMEDEKIPLLIRPHLLKIAQIADWGRDALYQGGRIFYMGAGTSGRLDGHKRHVHNGQELIDKAPYLTVLIIRNRLRDQ